MLKKIVKKVLFTCINYIGIHFVPKRILTDISPKSAECILQNHSSNPGTSAIWDNSGTGEDLDLTIVIPVYNVEKYLEKCLKSAINQKTDYLYEILIVNDCSPDNSENILKKYEYVSNLTVLRHPVNKGVSAARNTALCTARGNYVMFLDSDDFIADNTVQALLDYAYRLDADIVQGGYNYIDDVTENVIHREVYKYCEKAAPNGVIAGLVCGKAYKANLFGNICFPEKYWYEDTIITALVTHIAKTIVAIPEILYYYRQNPCGASMFGKGKPKSIDTFWIHRCVLAAREHLGLEADIKFYEHMLRMVVLSYKRTVSEPEPIKHSMFILFGEMLKNMRKDSFKVRKRYANLEKAIMEKDYNRYAFLCKML